METCARHKIKAVRLVDVATQQLTRFGGTSVAYFDGPLRRKALRCRTYGQLCRVAKQMRRHGFRLSEEFLRAG